MALEAQEQLTTCSKRTVFKMKVASILVLVLTLLLPSSTLGWWPFTSGEDSAPGPEEEKQNEAHTAVPPKLAKFEVAHAEKKFLVEAQKYLESMSPLERCHHVVSTSCLQEQSLGRRLGCQDLGNWARTCNPYT